MVLAGKVKLEGEEAVVACGAKAMAVWQIACNQPGHGGELENSQTI